MKPPSALILLLVLASVLMLAGCTQPVLNSSGQPSRSATPTPTPGPVVAAEPYPPAEPYEIDPKFVRNDLRYRVDPGLFTEVYNGSYTLKWSSIGLLATVEEAPMVLDFSVTPGSRDPVYSFFILTVRDAGSGVVVGQEGYGRTFSTENPKRLVFTSPGKYHINLYGSLVDVDLAVSLKK
ncbi:MAG TPA: hypothetical protein VKO45_06835 [Methanomicrobiales archaeon]|nr:hypothetical protein [Methanomicrobiales archaeon]